MPQHSGSFGVILVAALLGFGPPRPDDLAATARGRVVAIAAAPASQLAARSPVHRVADAVTIGGLAFPAVVDHGKLHVASAPDKKPDPIVILGRPLAFEFPGKKPQKILVTFIADGDGFAYFASEGRGFDVAGARIELIDADVDGQFTIDRDAYRISGQTHVLPLEQELVIGLQLVTIGSLDGDGKTLETKCAPLKGSGSQLAALKEINDARARDGLPFVRLDEEMSRGCTEHAEYLAKNHWTGLTNPHGQTLGPDGASPAGALSAQRSVIGKDAPADSIAGFWRTYYHRIAFSSPLLRRVGINASPPDLSVIDVHEGYSGSGDAGGTWNDPVTVPSNGSTGQQSQANSEFPRDPVERLGDRGFPLMVVFLKAEPGVSDFSGRLFEIRKSKETELPVLIADPGQHVSARGIVPSSPLKKATEYRVEFKFTAAGNARTISSRFRTG